MVVLPAGPGPPGSVEGQLPGIQLAGFGGPVAGEEDEPGPGGEDDEDGVVHNYPVVLWEGPA